MKKTLLFLALLLASSSSYVFGVVANCSADNASEIVAVNAATSCDDVTGLTATATSATLTWTSDAGNFIVYSIDSTGEATPIDLAVSDNEATLLGLNSVTTYTFGVAANCGNEESEMVTKSFTTLISCPAPTGLAATLTPGDGTVATLNWDNNEDALSWQILLNNDTNNLLIAYENTLDLMGLTPEAVYTAQVRAICAVDDHSEWSTVLTFQPTTKAVIGSGDATTNNLPTGCWYKYALTQQIYTAEEIGEAGSILSADFYNTSSADQTRTLDVYMVATAKSTFDTVTDWIPVTAADLVYSGVVTFASNAWTTINFDVPFTYDGENNVAIIIDDNTGSWSSQTPFKAFSATAQALRVMSDVTNYDPTAPTVAGTMPNVKNQIRLLVGEEPECLPVTGLTATNIAGHSATLTWTSDAGNFIVYSIDSTGEATPIDLAVTDNTAIITGLNPVTTYTFGVTANCGGAESDMRTVTFTTLVSCPAPTGLAATLTPGDGTVATLSWDNNEEALSWQILLNNDTNDLLVAFENTLDLTGLTAEQIYTAQVRAICDVDDYSEWSAVLTFQPTTKTVIGSGDATNSYLPTNCYYKNALTQQIYTAEEIGEAGSILSADFYNTRSADRTRTLDVYMVATAKSTFDSVTDWIPVTAADLVYSGEVTFAADAWTTINFDVPFTYDGENNVAIIIDDNTGSYSSTTPFKAFSATAQALYVYNDDTNFDPTAPTYSGTVEDTKNQIRLLVGEESECLPVTGLTATANSATLTWTSDADGFIVYSIDSTGEATPIDLAVIDNEATILGLEPMTTYTYGVAANCGSAVSYMRTVTFTTGCAAVALPFTETFEETSTTIACWSVADIASGTGITTSGAFKFAYNTNPPQYLISPELNAGESNLNVSFDYWIQSVSYPESFQLGYSTTDNEVESFTWGVEQTNLTNLTAERYSEIVPANTKYIAIKYTAYDAYYLFINSLTITEMSGDYCFGVANLEVSGATTTSVTLTWSDESNSGATYTVYNDSVVVANGITATTYTVTGLTSSTSYVFGVVTNCSADNASEMVTVNAATSCDDVTVFPYTEGFDNGGLGCWSTVNGSSDGYPWMYSTDVPHSGVGHAASWSYNNDPVHANAWLISPKFVIPADESLTLSWWHKVDPYFPEKYDVLISTTTNDTAAFTTTLLAVIPDSIGNYVQKSVDLAAYAGQQVYIAFHHHDSYDQYYLYIDDITLGSGSTPVTEDTLVLNVAVNDATMGTTNPAPGTYYLGEGDSLMIVATPAAGYSVIGWERTVTIDDDGETYTQTFHIDINQDTLVIYADHFMDYSPVTYKVLFGVPDTLTITMAVNNTTRGTTVPAPGVHTYVTGEIVSFEAIPDSGYQFVEWIIAHTEDGEAETHYTSSNPAGWPATTFMDRMPVTITAYFESIPEPDTLMLTLAVNDTAMGTITPAPGTYVYYTGDTVFFSAITNAGHRFDNWTLSVEGEVVDTITYQAAYSPIEVLHYSYGNDITLTANFSAIDPDTLYVTMAVNHPDWGTTNPAPGTYVYSNGDTVTFYAIPNDGYHFTQWSDGDNTNPRIITVTQDITIFALFDADNVQNIACPGWNNPANFSVGNSRGYYQGQTGTRTDNISPNVMTGTTGMTFNSTVFTRGALAAVTSNGGGDCATFPSGYAQNKAFDIMSGSGYDPNTDNLLPLVPTQFNTYDTTDYIVNTNLTTSIRIGDACGGTNATALYYNVRVIPRNALFFIYYACVVESPGHGTENDPVFVIRVMKKNASNQWEQINDTLAYMVPLTPSTMTDGTVTIGQDGWHSCSFNDGLENVYWKEWSKVALNLSNYLYQDLRIEVMISDCGYPQHFAYAYIAGECREMKIAMEENTLMAPRDLNNYVWYVSEYDFLPDGMEADPMYTWRQLTPDEGPNLHNYNVQPDDFRFTRHLLPDGTSVTVDSIGYSYMQTFRCKITTALDPSKPFDTYLFCKIFRPEFIIIADSYDSTEGTVTGNGLYWLGDTAIITAIPNDSYHFTQWSDGDTTNPRIVTVTQDTTLTALFAIDSFSVTLQVDSITHGTCSGQGNYVYGTFATVTAIPYSGYEFSHWSDGATYNPYTFAVMDNILLTAYFHVIGEPYQDTIIIHDTTYVHDTTVVVDTMIVDHYIYDTVTIIDTVTQTQYVPVHDTTYITLTDTVTNTIYDTITNTVFDTITNTVHDTVNNYIYDTVTHTVYDTALVTVTDTLVLTEHDTVYITLYDTVYFHDTVYVGVDDVEAMNVKLYQRDGMIVVEGAEGEQVWLYDAVGRMVSGKRREESGKISFDVRTSGVYLVKVGDYPARRVVVIR